jgi:hypothetical protein
MTRTFIRLPEFEKQCKRLGLSEDDIIEIENTLLDNPAAGEIVKGTGGIRKLRYALYDNKGKSGGARIMYVDFAYYERIYFLTAYAKGEQDNLTQAERNELKATVKILELEAKGGHKS